MRNLFSFFTSKKGMASIPEGMRVYAVGDIHGCAAELDRLTDAIVEDSESGPENRVIVYLGDYIDRGPNSKGVIDRVLATPPGFEAHFIRGNHDQCLLDFLANPVLFRTWRDYGARETLLSYGIVPPLFDNEEAYTEARDRLVEAISSRHRAFFENLQYSVKIGGYFFTHAGVRPGLPLDEQVPDDLLWIREEFLSSGANFGMVVVHGHTPVPSAERRANRIGVDTGVYATGRLTAAVLESSECRFLHT